MSASDKKTDKVYNWIRAYIDQNKFSANLKIPSENVISMRLEVSRETVRHAMERLAGEELIVRVKGSGTYINKSAALSREPGRQTAFVKIGLILQGQDANANSWLIGGIRSALAGTEADLQVFFTDNKYSSERNCLDVVAHQDLDGFIVDGVKASLMNPIFYNNYYKELKYPKVINNDGKTARELLGRLIQAGHRNIAGIFVCDNYQSIEKFRGYVSTLRRYGVEFDDDYVKWCVSDEAHKPGFYKEVGKYLKGVPRCTAVVCCNYMILQAVLRALSAAGKTVPEDYSLVCFDYSKDDWREAGITCSINSGYEMGRKLGERLLWMIENREYRDHDYSYVFDARIYDGRSIRRIEAE